MQKQIEKASLPPGKGRGSRYFLRSEVAAALAQPCLALAPGSLGCQQWKDPETLKGCEGQKGKEAIQILLRRRITAYECILNLYLYLKKL